MMKKSVKLIIIGAVVVLVAVFAVYSAIQPVALETVTIEPKTAEAYFIEQGISVAGRTVDVYSAAAGQLKSVNVSENQSVKEGDIICVVDSTYLELEMIQLQSTIKSSRAQLDNLELTNAKEKDGLIISRNSLQSELKALQAQGSTTVLSKEEQLRLQNIIIEQCESDLQKANEAFENAKVLFGSGIISRDEYESAQKLVEIKQNALEQGIQQIKLIESSQTGNSGEYYSAMEQSLISQIAGLNESISKDYTSAMKVYYEALIEGGEASAMQLEKKIADCVVRSPISGVVAKLNIKDTNTVGVATPVATITDGAENSVEVYVSTNEIDDIHLNDEVDLILKRRNGDKTYAGSVTAIDSQAVIKMSLLGVEERRVRVTITPATGIEEIKTGYNVDVKFITYRENDRLLVPNTALFKNNDSDALWVVENGKAKMRNVEKGTELRTETVIEQGVSAGEIVIIKADDSAIKEGVRVK